MRLSMLTTSVLILITAASAMAATTLTLEGGQPQLTLLEQKSDALTYRVEVGRLEALTVDTRGGEFTRLIIPGFHGSMTEGAPELPQMNRLIALPAGGKAGITITNLRTRTVRLADHGLTNPLFPHQPSLSKSQKPEDVPFAYDTAAYAQARVERELVIVEYLGRMRAADLARLEIAPVRYLPQSGELEIVESFDLEVVFDQGWAETEHLQAATRSPFFASVYGMIDGVHIPALKADLVRQPVKMVIVTPSGFQAQLDDFIAWKTERGFTVITGVIGSPEVGSTTASIQTYLHDLYNAATPEDPAPSFVLFVGDVDQCPTWTTSDGASDRPYCETTGDLFPEMYYGRLSATDTAMLQGIIDKTLMYDSFSMPDPSYMENVTLIAGVDGTFGPTHGNGTIRYGQDYYYNPAHGITANTYYYPASGSSEAAIIADCSNGVGFVNYTAHGSVTSWADPTMTQSDVNGLTNDGKYFLAIGNCCQSATYDAAECFGETFLRAANKGAIGYIGGSNNTLWDEDVWWSVGALPGASIRDGMTYAETGSGVYDALFHEGANEVADPTMWYVTNGAVVFRGNLSVSEAASSNEEYYWNIYNLLGDPSIATYQGRPAANEMTYPETVFVGSTSMAVTGQWGTYVGCTQDGVLVGTGLIGQDGTGEIVFESILTPGVPLKMVAMVSSREPVIAELNVIVPAVVTIDPTVIDAGVETGITVTVMAEDGVTPKPGVDIWAEGLDYATTPIATDAGGVAVITVNYPYGPSLDIVGRDPADTYRLFTETIAVNALPLGNPDLAVTTDIGLNDMFPLNLPGTLHASCDQAGSTLYARMPDGSLHSVVGDQLTVTAAGPGQVTSMIALAGHDIHSEVFDVIEAYGTVAGKVTSGGTPVAGVVVNLVKDDVVFSVVTDAQGDYSGPEDVLVADYTLEADRFGYLHLEQVVLVNYGANTFDLALDPAPAGVLQGQAYDSVTMEPLTATVRVFRSDTGELYDEVTCGADGLYTTGDLPYFTYDVVVRAWHHVPANEPVVVDGPTVARDWALAPTAGDMLVIDDSVAAAAEPKFTEKGELLAEGYQPDGAKSVAELVADLEALGYGVTVVDAGAVDPATFWNYDLVVLGCGNNSTTLANTALRDGLVIFVQAGGHILLEGGELGYDQQSSGAFATDVLHTTDWNHDLSGDISIGVTSHYVATHPNNLANSTITGGGTAYADNDAMAPLPDAEMVASWTSYPSDASVIAYDPNPAPEGGQVVYFCFNYAVAGTERADLLENAVTWLLTPEAGDCTVSGTVTLHGQADHSGITVRALPNGPSATTGTDGTYLLDGLYAGPYTIVAEKEEWSVGTVPVEPTSGQHLTGIDMTLVPTVVSDFWDKPDLPINDNQTAVATVDVAVGPALTISGIEVFLDISHTFQGDLTVTLTSPDKASVILHNRTGSSTDNIYGWYPGELTPAESLDALIGLGLDGTWTLTVADGAGGDTGTFDEWCLRFTYGSGGISGVGDQGAPLAFRAYQNFPNPFNPATTIRFDIPRDSQVSVRIYDVAGRLVRELLNEDLPAATHTVMWDGSDSSGRRMASGIYYCRVAADDHIVTRKMTLVK
ncbi:MAG: T9SS type A sorting domain-containing protein [bacterium]|nr:T9SS type A sorting domain-containing protein [bacterium]